VNSKLKHQGDGAGETSRNDSKNYDLKQQGDGAGEHLNYDKLRVAGHGLGNTRARRTNTAKRAPNMPMHHRHVAVRVCTISILWNFYTNPCHPRETTS
jgi:hypothetical protein